MSYCEACSNVIHAHKSRAQHTVHPLASGATSAGAAAAPAAPRAASRRKTRHAPSDTDGSSTSGNDADSDGERRRRRATASAQAPSASSGALPDHLTKFANMLKMGIPPAAVHHAMVKASCPASDQRAVLAPVGAADLVTEAAPAASAAGGRGALLAGITGGAAKLKPSPRSDAPSSSTTGKAGPGAAPAAAAKQPLAALSLADQITLRGQEFQKRLQAGGGIPAVVPAAVRPPPAPQGIAGVLTAGLSSLRKRVVGRGSPTTPDTRDREHSESGEDSEWTS
jgi:hypothetical protein